MTVMITVTYIIDKSKWKSSLNTALNTPKIELILWKNKYMANYTAV